MKNHYAFLRPALLSFVEEKLASFASIREHQGVFQDFVRIDKTLGCTPFKDLLRELNLSEPEFSQRFLNPWRELSSSQLTKVLKYVNWAHRFRFGQELTLKPLSELNALHWTIIQVYKLNLNGLTLFLHTPDWIEHHREEPTTDVLTHLYQAEPFCLPHRQCYWCGRLDHDPRGKAFGHRGLSLCHQSQCLMHSVNLPDHPNDCCYRQWNALKDSLKQTLKNQKQSEDKMTQTFLAFCEKRFQQNLNQSYRPRPQQEKPPQWKHPWTDLENRNSQGHFTP